MSRGVVAAGHPLTAETGAAVMREGGNAVDAAVAAVLTSFVTESPLTGLGAGGYMLVHTPEETALLDFFVAVPGTPAGLELAVERYGSVALAELAAPAARLAREGFAIGPEPAYFLSILG